MITAISYHFQWGMIGKAFIEAKTQKKKTWQIKNYKLKITKTSNKLNITLQKMKQINEMGAVCSQKNDAPLDATNRRSMDSYEEKQSLMRADTLAGIETEEEVSFYDIGQGIHAINHSVASRWNETDPTEYLKIWVKSGAHISWHSCMVHICKADGTLSEKEEAFIVQVCKGGGVTNEDDLNLILEGHDTSKQMITDLYKVFNHFFSKTKTKEEIDKKVIGLKKGCILYAILAAAQDGFVRDEYQSATKMAIQIGLTKQHVKDCIQLVKMEIALAKKAKQMSNA